MPSPREPVRRHKTRQFAPEIGEEMEMRLGHNNPVHHYRLGEE